MKTFHIEAPNPIEAIKIRMEEMGLKQKDLIPEIEELIRFQDFRQRNVKVGENKFIEKYAFTTDQDIRSI